jgi:ubiquinone/menaquinone biosynthesis C-methylase UbiE
MSVPDSDWKSSQDHEEEVYSDRDTIASAERARNQFQKFGKNINEVTGKRILSIGAGMGIVHSINFECESIALDPLISHNKEKLQGSSARLVDGVGEFLPFEDNSIDIVHSYNALDHCIEPESVLNEAYRVTKDSGELLLELNTYEVPEFLRNHLIDHLDTEHPHHFSSNEVEKMVNDAGYKITHSNRFNRFKLLKNLNLRRFGGCLFRMRRNFITGIK